MKKQTLIKTILFIVLIACGLLAAAFTFNFFAGESVPPGRVEAKDTAAPPAETTQAEVRQVKEWYEAVGTVRPRTEASIEAQVMAQVMDVKVNPGDPVQKDQLLVVLDSRQFDSRLDQAREGLKSAEAAKKQAGQSVAAARAAFSQAQADYRRITTYYESQAATEQQLEAARSAYLQAEAGLKRAREGMAGSDAQIEQAMEVVREAEIALGYTTLKAPEAGEVLKKLVEPGDLALPGKPLLILQTSGNLRLEAHVREGLIDRVRVGDKLPMEIRTQDTPIEATVEEIIPYADPQTRTFLVKAAVPARPGLYPGMFGKLLIPVREHPVVLVPERAIRSVGQLELVTVKEPDGWRSRFIKTGKTIDDKVVVMSGLSGDETIGLEGSR